MSDNSNHSRLASMAMAGIDVSQRTVSVDLSDEINILEGVAEDLENDMIRVLQNDWQSHVKCPECGYAADRQKCAFDLGGYCPRHESENYDYEVIATVSKEVTRPSSNERAKLIRTAISMLRNAERP